MAMSSIMLAALMATRTKRCIVLAVSVKAGQAHAPLLAAVTETVVDESDDQYQAERRNQQQECVDPVRGDRVGEGRSAPSFRSL